MSPGLWLDGGPLSGGLAIRCSLPLLSRKRWLGAGCKLFLLLTFCLKHSLLSAVRGPAPVPAAVARWRRSGIRELCEARGPGYVVTEADIRTVTAAAMQKLREGGALMPPTGCR